MTMPAPHTARLVTQFLTANNVDVMQWPSLSSDLSPIEHIWDELDRRVRRRPNHLQSLAELEQALIQEWNNLPLVLIRRYIRSMSRRCNAVINSRGGHTKY